jgi:hypothetical protein
MSEKQQIEFKWVCREYLAQQGLAALRAYGREVGVGEPTKKSKSVLIDEIVAILMGEKEPIARSRRGAPVKDDFVDPKILAQIATLKKEYSINQGNDIYDLEGRLQATKENEIVLMVEDPNAAELEKHDIRSIYKGQLVMRASGQAVILPLNGKEEAREVLLPANLMNMFDLREGDVLTYHVERRNGFWVATAILTINECVTDFFVRRSFDGAEVCYPKEKIRFFLAFILSGIGIFLSLIAVFCGISVILSDAGGGESMIEGGSLFAYIFVYLTEMLAALFAASASMLGAFFTFSVRKQEKKALKYTILTLFCVNSVFSVLDILIALVMIL